MSSEEISLIASHPFIRKFVYAIVQDIRARNFDYEKRSVIHADFVPKVSERVMQASLKKQPVLDSSFMPSLEVVEPPVARPVIPRRRVMGPPVVSPVPVQRPVPTRQPMAAPQMMPQPAPVPVQPAQLMPKAAPLPVRPAPQAAPLPVRPPIQLPNAPGGAGLSQDYGKITPLLHDESVSTIDCPGVGKPITIIRTGQKQMTKISLSGDEIKEILQKVSDAVHIPLLEGVFRAAVDNFSINAVISEMIGSRFVIKKQNAYAMLEKRGI